MKPNVILVTIDSLRADHVTNYGYHRNTTPNIQKFCKLATTYENAYVNGPNTPNSFPSILYSRYIFESDNFKIPKHWKSIASILKAQGYNTIGFNSGNPWLSKYIGYGKGFDKYHEYLEQHKKAMSKKMKSKILKIFYNLFIENFTKSKKELDKRFSEDILRVIPKLKQPYFIWVHFMDVHHPYVPHKEFCKFGKANRLSNMSVTYLNYLVKSNRKSNESQNQKIIDLYDSSILQVDNSIGKILNLLKKHHNFENSIVIITSDHGEGFKEHGTFLHHTTDPYNELLKVPLVIKYPKQSSSRKIKDDISLINLLPTITDTLNIKDQLFQRGKALPRSNQSINEILFSEGYEVTIKDSVSSTKAKEPVISTLKKENWKLIIDYLHNKYKLFDLASDPKEKSNLIRTNKDVLIELTTLLDEHISKENKIKKMEKSIHKKIKLRL
jgi:arylsulfatase A-like enzyme